MNKILGRFALLCFASTAITSSIQADTLGFKVGAYQWLPDYTGTLTSDTDDISGTAIDVHNDLGFSDESHNVFYASFEHPLPFIPNVKVVLSDISTSASSTLERDVIFDGENYLLNEDVATAIDMSNTEFTFYYELLDNWINIDVGLTLRQYDGLVRLTTDDSNGVEDLDFTLPLLYAAARIDLPLTGFFVDSHINIISYDDNSVSDLAFSLGYESDIGFGASLGYRTFSLDVEVDSFATDLKFDGAYINVFYHF